MSYDLVEAMRLDELLDYVRDRLSAAHIEAPARQARLLISTIASVPPEDFLGRPNLVMPKEVCAEVAAAMEKRVGGMPLGRIAGEREFYGRSFELGPATLEPRPDSETLIDAALEIVQTEGLVDRPIRIVDVGTGTGCLLITLLAELPLAEGLGIDIAQGAVEIARRNAARNGVERRAVFECGDLLAGVDETFDLLISNPPYINTADIPDLDREVREHDPLLALDGGTDGLDFYRRIAGDVNLVVPQGWSIFEVGAGMSNAVCREIDQIAGQRRWRVWQDLNSHERCVASKSLLYP